MAHLVDLKQVPAHVHQQSAGVFHNAGGVRWQLRRLGEQVVLQLAASGGERMAVSGRPSAGSPSPRLTVRPAAALTRLLSAVFEAALATGFQ